MAGIDVGLIIGVVSPPSPLVGAGVGMGEGTDNILQIDINQSIPSYL